MITGSLQIKNKQWYAILNLYVDGKRKPKWVPTGVVAPGNKRAANEAIKSIIQEYEDKERQYTPEAAQEPFVDYMQNWLSATKASIQPTTMVSYAHMVNGRIERYFRPKGIKLGELQPIHIHDFYQEILAEVVQFTGGGVYKSSNATTPAHSRPASRCKVTVLSNGAKYPLHIVSEDGGGVHGWVAASDVKAIGQAAATFKEYTVRVQGGATIRTGAGANFPAAGTIPTGGGVYTIVEESNSFGRLKSGAGWLPLGAVTKI